MDQVDGVRPPVWRHERRKPALISRAAWAFRGGGVPRCRRSYEHESGYAHRWGSRFRKTAFGTECERIGELEVVYGLSLASGQLLAVGRRVGELRSMMPPLHFVPLQFQDRQAP